MSDPNGFSDLILVLGDEAKSASALERLLKVAGYNAIAINSFDLARAHLAARAASLIVVDLSASRLTGPLIETGDDDSGTSLGRLKWAAEAMSFCNDVRAVKATAELPILILSKSQRAQDKVACLNNGASAYIVKPYQRGELLSSVRLHLRAWRNERERTERFEQLNVLHAVSSVLSSSLEPDVLVQATLSVLVKNLSVDAGVGYLRSAGNQAVAVVASEGFSATEECVSSLLDLYSRTAPLMDDKHLLLEPLPPSARRGLAGEILNDVRSMVCAPVGLKGKTIGAICLFTRNQNSLPRQQAELLATICNQLSVALENARLYVETKKSAAQLSFVYNLGNNLMTSLEMDELLGYAVFTVGKSLECDVCAVVVRANSEDEEPVSAIYSRLHGEDHGSDDWYNAERVRAYLDRADFAIQSAIETRVAERFLTNPRISIETVVPLMFDDRLMGLLICASRKPRSINSDDQKLLGAVAQQLSLAIRNTELYQRTKDTSINLAVEVSRRTREIEEQKRFTEKIIDSLPVSLYVVDRDMRIVAWNRNREVGGQGMSRDAVLGRNVFHVLARQPRRILEDEFTEVFRSGDMVRVEQESWIDNQKKTWKISKIPMRVDNCEVTHVITVGEDVTDQKKMNEAVIHAEKLASIGRLAAGVVHELNNPLATIAACAEALNVRVEEIESQGLSQDFGEYLQIIRDEAFRCKTITNSLLEFSHQRQAEKHSSDINQIIERTLHLVKHHPKIGNMHVVKELDARLPLVYVNEGQMKQVFIALISNAYDAMEHGGRITIRTRWQDCENERAVAVEFEDSGCGIPASHLQKIFDPFFTTKPLGRGTGLGLSVCYGIVSEHGGKMEVDSTEGVGSTFRVLLPVSPEVQSEQAPKVVTDPILEMESTL
ncbi:MAG TPA: ATP-binding protein [Blastocatellia bacterium]|nr:ATP-binding protein [Blastocatellia bacterium]